MTSNNNKYKSKYTIEERIFFTLRDIKNELVKFKHIDIDEQTKELLKNSIENMNRLSKTLSLYYDSIEEIEKSLKAIATVLNHVAKKLELSEEIKNLLKEIR